MPYVKPFRFFSALTTMTVVLAAVVALRVRGFNHIDALSAWLFLAAVAGGTILLLELGLRAMAIAPLGRMRGRLLVGTCLVLLFATEAALRYGTPRWATYMERNGGTYFSLFSGEPTWFHIHWPGSSYTESKAEFTHVRQITTLGFTDREFVAEKAPGEYRILALGDSFTEGVGTSVDTTWVRVAEARLGERYPGRRVTTLNAGVSGMDPYFEYMLLREKLHPFHPDLVIVVINTSDVNEVMVRGGMERFQPDGTVSYKINPGWERLYGLSYIWRAIVHEVFGYNFLLVRNRDLPAHEGEAVRLLGAALELIEEFCRARGIDLLIASHPNRQELEQGHHITPAYDDLMRRLEREPDLHFVDLMPYYTERGLITKSTAAKFYWPLDLHHNTDGYRIMGEAIAANVIERGLGPERQPVLRTSGGPPAEAPGQVAP